MKSTGNQGRNTRIDRDDRLAYWRRAGPDTIAAAASAEFGETNRHLSTMRDLRFGAKGSISVILIGNKAGQFFDHEAGEGGILRIPDADFAELAGPNDKPAQRGIPTRPACRIDPAEAERRKRNAAQDEADEIAEKVAAARRIWRETVPLDGSIAAQYLREVRGRDPGGCCDLKFHPAQWHAGRMWPCLVALMRDVQTGAGRAVHRTYLDPKSASKVTRKTRGSLHNVAIMLDPFDAPTYGLALAEGIETGLAARTLFRPMWVPGSAGGIAKFPVLDGIDCLTIFADAASDKDRAKGDAEGPGVRAAKTSAQRWADAGREAVIRQMPQGDYDDAVATGGPHDE